MTDWTPGVVILSASAAIGTFLALRARRGRTLPDEAETRRTDLLRQKEAALALLREHEAVKADWEAGAWDAEKARLERAAAGVLRELDALSGPSAPAPHPVGVAARHPQLVGALWGAGAVLLIGSVAWGLQEYSKPKESAAVMEGQDERVDAELQALKDQVAANPDDLQLKNKLGHALINANQMMDAYKLSEEVVAKENDDPEARTHQAVVLVAIGDMDVAAKVLDRVLATHPDYPEALGWRGAVYYQTGEREKAADIWEKAIAADPELTTSLQPLINAARMPEDQLAAMQKQGVGAEAGPMAGAGAGPMAGGAAPADAAPSADDVSGEIRGDDGAAKPGDTLMLFARAEGVDRGPPVWAQRLQVTSLPMKFRIGPADAPMGGATPAKLVLTARIDRDGNPMQTSSGEAEGRSEAVAPGASDVVVQLTVAP